MASPGSTGTGASLWHSVTCKERLERLKTSSRESSRGYLLRAAANWASTGFMMACFLAVLGADSRKQVHLESKTPFSAASGPDNRA